MLVPWECRNSYGVSTAKDTKVTVMVAEGDLAMLKELSAADDVSASHVVRVLIRRAHADRFGEKKSKTKR